MDERDAAIEVQVRGFLKQIAPARSAQVDALAADARVWAVLESLSLLDLLALLEDHFRMVIAPVDVVPENFQTVERIVRFLRRRTDGAA